MTSSPHADQGAPITRENPFARARATELALHTVQNGRAARVVAHNALDLEDCISLLDMLGLDAVEARTAP